MFCGHCGLENSAEAVFCRGCGKALPVPAGPSQPQEPGSSSPEGSAPTPPARRPLVFVVAAIVLILLVAVVVMASNRSDRKNDVTADSTSTSSTTAAPAAGTGAASTMDVASLLPPFHQELKRLVAPRNGVPPAILVASSPRSDPPRPVTFTLLEWDRGAYKAADHVDIDCGFLENLHIDEDQAVFLGCTGGASAHYAWALLPDPLKITVLPAGTTDNPQGGWLASFTTVPRPRQPDDLTLLARRCEPDCASGKTDTFSLVWDPTFRLWELDQCTPEGEAPRRYHGVNGSVVDITYRGCPHFDMPGD